MKVTITRTASPEADGAAESQAAGSLNEAIMLGLERMGIAPPAQVLQDDQSFRDDVLGYHFLHFGNSSELAREALNPETDLGDIESWAEPFDEELNRIMETDTIKRWELGRIGVEPETLIDERLREFVEGFGMPETETADPADDPSYSELFLYPKEGAVLRYQKRSTINLPEEGLAFNADTFVIGNMMKRGTRYLVFNALSHSDGESTHLKKIEEVGDLSTTVKRTFW